MSRKRGFATQMIRHLIQFAAFVLSPGLFIVVFGAVRDILKALINGSFSVAGLASQLVTVFSVFLITALWGRFFCGFLCSFGTMQELIFGLTEKRIAKKVRLSAGIDYAMKFVKYFIFVFIVAGVWILALPVDDSFNPWGVFGMLVSGNVSLISASVPTAGFALLLAICFGSLFVERFFCRYLCPLGAMLAIVSGKRLYKIRRESETCTNCGLCVRKCSMGIDIPKKTAVTSGECIQCMQCLDACPKESLSVNPAGAIAGTAAAAAMGGMVAAGNLIIVPAAAKISDEQVEEKPLQGKFKDGVYMGSGAGFRGNTEVQVTVENGYISDITVLSFKDDREFFGKAQSAVISEMIAGQTFDVAPVSGATFSSNSIMEAVASALGNGAGSPTQPLKEGTDSGQRQPAGEGNDSGAGQEVGEGTGAGQGSGEGNETGGSQSDGNGDRADAGQPVGDGTAFGTDQGMTGIEKEKKEYDLEQSGGESRQPEEDALTRLDNETDSDTASGGVTVSDGVYEGTGRGLRGNTKVSVTVEEGAIADITILSFEDDDAFFNRARNAVISEIIRTQSPEVVPVSGATFSSNSIMEAVASALGNGAVSRTQPLDEGTDSGKGQPAGAGNGTRAGQGDGEGNGSGAGQSAGEGNGTESGNGGETGQGSGAGNGSGHGHGRHGGGRRGKGGQNK